AVGMLAGASNAWADLTPTTTVYDFEDSNARFSQDSRITVAIANDDVLNSNVVSFTNASNAGNGNAIAHFDFSSLVTNAEKVVLNFDYWCNTNGRNALTIGDATIRTASAINSSTKQQYIETGAILKIGANTSYFQVNNANIGAYPIASLGIWMNVNVEVDVTNQKVSYTIKKKSDNSIVTSASNIAYFKTAEVCSQLDIWGYNSSINIIKLDNLSITSYVNKATKYTDYTFNYLDESNNELKDATNGNGEVGKNPSLSSVVKENIWKDGVKYIYSSDNSSSVTIAEDNSTVVNIIFSVAPSYTYSVTDNLGNILVNGSAYEGENVNFWVPYFVFKAGKFYQSPSLSSGTLSYGQSTITNISANTNITVTYTEEENTNVVFFSEAENLTGVTSYEDGYTQIRMSNGKVGYYGSQTAFVTLPAGTYTLTASTRSGETKFYKGSVGDGTEILTMSSSGTVVNPTSDPFTLTEATDIYTSTGGTSTYFDYVIIRKTAVPAIITAGWSTLYTDYALDFSGVDGLTAYTAKCDGSKVTLTKVENVPAGTGVVLKGDAKTYDIPVAASSSTAKGDLKGSTTESTYWNAFPGEYLYMLAMNDGKAQFTRVTEGEIPVGKAYLRVVQDTDAPSLYIVLGGTTGINAVQGSEFTVNGEYYNLAGQRVAQPTKGLYIVNGKKVVVK
ncbi:MAG: hypothetical protein IJV13_01255, partial [Prevotella sp.]|nr:hypothetical protein [Prevotella sp.]